MFEAGINVNDSSPSEDFGNVSRFDLGCREDARKQLAESVISKYRKRLWVYLRSKLQSPDDAEDLLQDVCLRIFNYRKLNDVESLDSFVFTIAVNLLRDRSRRSYTKLAERSMPIDEVYYLRADTASPERVVEGIRALESAKRVILELNPRCRKAFLMHRIDGKSHKEVATVMGVSVSMVEKHVGEAMKNLRRHKELSF